MAEPDPDPALEAAFRATDYVLRLPGGMLVLAVDRPSARLAGLIAASPPGGAFVTAFNPGARRCPAAANRARHARLLARLGALGLRWFPAHAEARDGRWPREDGVFVRGIGRREALALGREFDQVAVLWAGRDGRPRLLWCARPPASRAEAVGRSGTEEA